ncbi:MAG: type II toxin-antitoxin system MqsA family antitoxin [Clostridia bacterium]|jgi:YgiT-type zinc finger domain-containing protein
MNCFMCKGKLEEKNTTFMVELDNCIIIIKNVPSLVCEQCGEVLYSNEVSKQLEKLVNAVRNSITEITIINYSEKVA